LLKTPRYLVRREEAIQARTRDKNYRIFAVSICAISCPFCFFERIQANRQMIIIRGATQRTRMQIFIKNRIYVGVYFPSIETVSFLNKKRRLAVASRKYGRRTIYDRIGVYIV